MYLNIVVHRVSLSPRVNNALSSRIRQPPDANREPLGAVDGTIDLLLAKLQQLQVYSQKYPHMFVTAAREWNSIFP